MYNHYVGLPQLQGHGKWTEWERNTPEKKVKCTEKQTCIIDSKVSAIFSSN